MNIKNKLISTIQEAPQDTISEIGWIILFLNPILYLMQILFFKKFYYSYDLFVFIELGLTQLFIFVLMIKNPTKMLFYNLATCGVLLGLLLRLEIIYSTTSF